MILVTGGAGYIGSHAVLYLINKGLEVVIFDNLVTGHIETVNRLKSLSDNVHFVHGDLKNIDNIKNIFNMYKIDSVMHFAGCSVVPESVLKPDKYYLNNVVGSLNLLNTMVEFGVTKIVFSSSCATYGDPLYTPIDEKHQQNPITPYGQTKLMIEKFLGDYDIAYGLKSVKLRYFNVIGADAQSRIGEWHEPETHLVPNILKSCVCDQGCLEVFGDDYDTKDGTCIRDYIDVEDLVEAHYLALNYLEVENCSNEFNIGSSFGFSVKEVLDAVNEVVAKPINCKIGPKRKGDTPVLYANNSKAAQTLNWKPKTVLVESIKKAYEWEKSLRCLIDDQTSDPSLLPPFFTK